MNKQISFLIFLTLTVSGCAINRTLEEQPIVQPLNVPEMGWAVAHVPVEVEGRVLQCLPFFKDGQMDKLACDKGPGIGMVVIDNVSKIPTAILAGTGSALIKARAIREVADTAWEAQERISAGNRQSAESIARIQGDALIEANKGPEVINIDNSDRSVRFSQSQGQQAQGGVGLGGDANSAALAGSNAENTTGVGVDVDVDPTFVDQSQTEANAGAANLTDIQLETIQEGVWRN